MRYRRNDNVKKRSVADSSLLIPLDNAARSVYTLNETGCLLWELIARFRHEEELVEALLEQYAEISRETAQHDVRVFLDDMVRMELVEER